MTCYLSIGTLSTCSLTHWHVCALKCSTVRLINGFFSIDVQHFFSGLMKCVNWLCTPFPQIGIIGAMMIVWRVCSVRYCVQQLCTVQCVHVWTDLTVIVSKVVCWLGLAFLWLCCVLKFICVRFNFLGLFCVIVYLFTCMCAFVVRFSFFTTVPRDWLGRTSPKWAILSSGV